MTDQYGGNYGLTQFEFDPDNDLKHYPLWVADLVHAPKPWKPLSAWLWCDGLTHGMQYGAEMASMPGSKGWDMRLINGYLYLGVITCEPDERYIDLEEITDQLKIPKQVKYGRVQPAEFKSDYYSVGVPDDIPKRGDLFRERTRVILEDYDGLWKKEMEEWSKELEYFKEICHPKRLKELSNIELWEVMEDFLVRVHRGWWAVHMIWMQPVYGFYNLFAELCEQLTGIDVENPTFKKLLGGYDNVLFRLNKENWQLARKAEEMGLKDLFLSTENDEELFGRLQQDNKGKEWFDDYIQFVNTNGWRLTETWDVASPSWIERPSLGLQDIKTNLAASGGFTPDEERKRLSKERLEAEKEIIAKVPEANKEMFKLLMNIAQKSGSFSEEHNLFIDIPACAISRHVFMEYGRRFSRAGVIDKQEDILFLFPEEIRRAAIASNRVDLRPFVKRYRDEWERNCQTKPEPFIGDIERIGEIATKDALVRVIAIPPRVKPELKADLYGGSSVSGVVEGLARVVMDYSGLKDVKPGEILVAPCTAVPWTPVFGIISGVVTDAGGSLAHAAIVAREYGIPAVIGTQAGTAKIKTGDKIKVDGTNGCVYILK
jgi:phosphohistidine swiveling domain-containing protein